MSQMQKRRSACWLIAFLYFGVLLLKETGLWTLLTDILSAILPLLAGIIIAFLFEPLIIRCKCKRIFASLLVYLSFFLLLAIVIGSFIPLVISQLTVFFEHIDEYLTLWEQFYQSRYFSFLTQDTEVFLADGYDVILDKTFQAVGFLKNAGISFLAAFFISADMDFLMKLARRLIHEFNRFQVFYQTASQVVFHYLRGMSLDLLFVFLSSALTLFLFGYRSWLFYALILALLQLLPYIGPWIAIALLLLFSYVDNGRIVWESVLVIIVLQQLEANIVQPYIFHKVMDLRPIVTLSAMLLLGALFGMGGLVIAPIVAGIAQLTLQSYLYAKQQETVGSFDEIWYNFNDFQSEEEEE